MYYNREDELKILEDEYKRDGSAFSVIYGRRRVGKTALIKKFIEDKPTLFIYATEANLLVQLEDLKPKLLQLLNKPYLVDLPLVSFEQMFSILTEYDFKQKLVIVIDEYQNLCKIDRAFSSMLQKVWDMQLKELNIHLILCGSVVSMMHSEVLNYSAPLYGRRTSNIHLKPLKFDHIKSFIPNISKEDEMRVFASFGTIPKYLESYDPKKTFLQNIEEKILDKNSFLYQEGSFLLKQELNEVATYFSILETISKGETKIGNIASRLQLSPTYLTRYLSRLIDLDILIKEIPVTEKNPLKSKMGRYRFKDKFLNFWFFYVYKNYNYLEIGETQSVLKEIELNFNDRFVSFAFEEYVLEKILQNPKKILGFTPCKIGRWWNKNEEIDIVAYDEQNIAFIECKWQNSVNREFELNRLIKKSTHLNHNLKESFFIFTKDDFLRSTV
jgi:AAA+ ATPase superfamily predicted ATPase